MARPLATEREQRERGVGRRTTSSSELEDEEREHRSGGKGRERVRVTHEAESAEARRRARLDAAAACRGNTPERRAEGLSDAKMASESQTTLRSSRTGTHRRRRESHHDEGEKVHRRRRTVDESRNAPNYVYGPPADKTRSSRIRVTERRDSFESSDSERDVVRSESSRSHSRKRKVKIIYVTKEEADRLRSRDREPVGKLSEKRSRDAEDVVRRSRASIPRPKSTSQAPPVSPPKRVPSSRYYPPNASKTSLKRSNTIASQTPSVQPSFAPSVATANSNSRRSSFLGNFFNAPAKPAAQEPERLIECLTCLSDDVPRSKSAKLKCGHRMCHSCLKRIFRLSVNDPQHMPPKCCTADHIPLKHVDRLFNIDFKKNWNKKYQEYTTKNRIYCPAKRCGEWIKPGNIHKEDGRKYGKCGRCKTKVCVLCNCKWHGSKECPKDEETNKLLDAAKEAGWQRCYSCRTMVELKEGCNHMTCRCTAEFCMICGLKWKSCNCPWFNYDAVEADRLNHMQVPQDANPEPAPQRRPWPNNYNDEVRMRRRQERADEALARRLQTLGLQGRGGDDQPANDDYQGGIGDIHGVGNAGDHFMNHDYVRAARNILTGNFDHATAAANYVMGFNQARAPPPPPTGQRGAAAVAAAPEPLDVRPASPPPVLRRQSMREQQQARGETAVPRRLRTASRDASPASRTSSGQTRGSVLAGLGGAGRGSGRVNAWRTHVEPGVEPAEGVLSM